MVRLFLNDFENLFFSFQVLELSDCTWLPPHSFMALSKLPILEELHLDGCYLIKDCIAYASLAFNMGFLSLKVCALFLGISCLSRAKTKVLIKITIYKFLPDFRFA